MRRLSAALVIACALAVEVAWPHRALAQESAACSASYQSAQRLRIGGHLRAARDELIACARPTCPSFIAQDCTSWLAEVEGALPTVVFAAIDESGADLAHAEISVDGAIVADATDGLPHAFDPGAHVVTSHIDGRIVVERIVLRAMEKARRIELRIAPLDVAATRAPMHRPVPVGTYAFGGLALGFGAAAAISWIIGTNDAHAYNARCASSGSCTSDDRASVLRELVVGDVSLAAAVVCAGVSAVLFITRPRIAVTLRPNAMGGAVLIGGVW